MALVARCMLGKNLINIVVQLEILQNFLDCLLRHAAFWVIRISSKELEAAPCITNVIKLMTKRSFSTERKVLSLHALSRVRKSCLVLFSHSCVAASMTYDAAKASTSSSSCSSP